MAALNFGNIAAGTESFYAGMDLASKRRQTERTEERDVMALEALRRQEALRQQQANAPAPETVTTGDLLGVGQQLWAKPILWGSFSRDTTGCNSGSSKCAIWTDGS